MVSSPSQASGTSIAMAWGRLRPDITSSSSTLSRMAESLPPGIATGNSFPISSPNRGEARIDCRASIHPRFPFRVLISPLWQSMWNGWASFHAGKVLVLKRWCTRQRALSVSGSASSR